MNVAQQKIKMLLLTPLLFLALPLLLSCTTFGGDKNDEESLLAHIQAFNTAVRWEDYKVASAAFPPPMQEDFWRQADAIQGRIKIMDYEIRNISLDQGGQRGTVLLRFRYYFTDDPHVRTKMLRQQWRYLEKEKTWQLARFNLEELLPERP